MKDYKLRDLRASHTLGSDCRRTHKDLKMQNKLTASKLKKKIASVLELISLLLSPLVFTNHETFRQWWTVMFLQALAVYIKIRKCLCMWNSRQVNYRIQKCSALSIRSVTRPD